MGSRHSLVCLVTLAHAPVLLSVAVLTHRVHVVLFGLALVVVLLAVAVGPFAERTRALCASSALLLCSLLLVDLFPEHPEIQAQLFVVVALVSLYQDWVVFIPAVACAVAQYTLLPLVVDPGASMTQPIAWAAVRATLVATEAAVLAIFWHTHGQAKAGENMLQAALWEGHASVQARLEETERIRTDLIGTVSHEFRTPLTGIRGAALTLLKRGDRLDETGRRQLLQAVLEQQARLSRLLENMLTAARATAADPSAVSDVHAVATEVVMLAGAARPQSPTVSLLVEPGTVALIDRHALHQVLANLVDNAQQYSAPGAIPLVAGGRDDDGVWVAVSNEGGVLDSAAAEYLFEPFTQGEAGTTRGHEGLGMGLYVVRRLVEVYDGWVTVRAEGGWVTVEIHLKPAGPGGAADLPRGVTAPAVTKLRASSSRGTQEPTALPIR